MQTRSIKVAMWGAEVGPFDEGEAAPSHCGLSRGGLFSLVESNCAAR